MTRLVWPAMLVLLVLAVAGPSLTFYLLIKDYWAEVSSLRRDLLFCQLGNTQLPLEFDLDLEVAASSHTVLPLPPTPLPLVATTASTITTTTTLSRSLPTIVHSNPSPPSSLASTNPPSSASSPSSDSSSTVLISRVPILSSPAPSVPAISSVSSGSSGIPAMVGVARPDVMPLHDTPGRHLEEGAWRRPGWRATRPPRSLSRSMVADQSTASDSTDVAEKEYVSLLEKQLRDLRARVNACRSCLPTPQRKLATCGGGKAWRDYRRRRRLLRRMEREQRRERRRRKKSRQLKKILDDTASRMPTTAPTTTPATTAPPTTAPTTTAPTTTAPTTTAPTTTAPTIIAPPTIPTTVAGADGDQVLADVAYGDQKLDNKRARETHRMSTDFRRGFNQKISRMDEALMQFTDTQAAFCKELRDNLGGRLEKRGQELEALSNQIAALVRTSTAQITALEKVASDQVEMLQDVYLTYATRQADTLQKLTEDVDMFASKHNNLVMRSRDHAKHLQINTHGFVRELQTRMSNVVKELVLIRLQSQNFVSINNDSHNDFSNSLNLTQAAVDTLSERLKARLDNATVLEQDFRKIFKRETNHFSDRVESGISQALASNHESISQVEEAELDTRVFVGSATAAWNELYLNQEAELRKEADSLTHSLRSHTHHTQNVLTGMRSAAETHELVLEEQRMNFQRFIRKRQDALDNQCSAISDWATLMSTELRRRDEDLHKFLSEDLQYTTVTVQEDEDGYLVSRLPDGSLVYQSSPAHARAAARPPPNVSYQLDETAYSPGLVSSTSHSSPSRPQLEKTVVTYVNNTLNKFRTSISNSTSENTNQSSVHSDFLSAQYITEQYNVLESNNKVSNRKSGSETQELGLHHFAAMARSEKSSFQEAERKHTPQETGRQVETHPDNAAYTQVHKEPDNVVGAGENLIQEIHILRDPEGNQTGDSQEKRQRRLSKILQRRQEIMDTYNRQNDGTYKPGCTSKCGNQSEHKETNKKMGQTRSDGSYVNYDDDDEDIKNLIKILHDAQETIKKFQMDFQPQGLSKHGNTSSRIWPLLVPGPIGKDTQFHATPERITLNETNDANSSETFAQVLEKHSVIPAKVYTDEEPSEEIPPY
ncbi:uncharacterized protein [Procambarus clarkii]|uniref:uncharacterized protein isoform X2 n=1 Tax=Procambarus clarkii TaxID=6728 RepID=UPI0037424C4C